MEMRGGDWLNQDTEVLRYCFCVREGGWEIFVSVFIRIR